MFKKKEEKKSYGSNIPHPHKFLYGPYCFHDTKVI